MATDALHPPVPRTPVPFSDTSTLLRAYAQCDEVIAAHGKTFNLASSLLPAPKRRGIRALYAFCRIADDIVDCRDYDLASCEARLADWRYRSTTASPPRGDPVALAWAHTRLRYHVPHGYCVQLIEGVGRDLHQFTYESFDDLVTYAYGVASTVGLMSLRIIGTAHGWTEEEAVPYVIKLGLALQLTNILRDVGEDRRAGRVYLPADELEAFGLCLSDLDGRCTHSEQARRRWSEFMAFQVRRNRALYREAWPCIRMFHPDGRFAVAAACSLYGSILENIEAHDYDVFTRRAHITTWGKVRRLPSIWWHNR
jgi:phytoene synthase